MGREKLVKDLNSKRKDFIDYTNAVESLNDKISELNVELDKLRPDIKEGNIKLRALRTEIKNLRRELNKHHQKMAELKKLGQDNQKEFKAAVKISKQVDGKLKDVEKLDKELGKMKKELLSAQEKLKDLRSQRKKINTQKFELAQNIHQVKLDIRETYTTERLANNQSLPYEAPGMETVGGKKKAAA